MEAKMAGIMAPLILSFLLSGANSQIPTISNTPFVQAKVPSDTRVRNFWHHPYQKQLISGGTQPIAIYTTQNIVPTLPVEMRIARTTQIQIQYPTWQGTPFISDLEQHAWANKVVVKKQCSSLLRPNIWGTITTYQLSTAMPLAIKAPSKSSLIKQRITLKFRLDLF